MRISFCLSFSIFLFVCYPLPFLPSLASLLLMLLLAQVLLTLDPVTGSVFVIMYIHFLESFGMDERKRREQDLRERRLESFPFSPLYRVICAFRFFFFFILYSSLSFISFPSFSVVEHENSLLTSSSSFSSLLILSSFFHLTMITLQNDL